MKQSVKLDILLRTLYKFRNNGEYYDFGEISKMSNLNLTEFEQETLLKRLRDDYLIDAKLFLGGEGIAKISSHGIDYVEGDSYTYKGSSIINNNYSTTITNSTGVSVVNASTNVYVNISNIEEVNTKIDELLKAVQTSSEVAQDKKDEIIECIDEIRTSLSQDKKPKFSLRALIEMTAGLAGIASLAIDIANLLPK